jgi:Superinfection immunity protein
MHDVLNTVLGLLMLAVVFAAYWAPTIVVLLRKHPAPGPTIVVNSLLGWTGIGWIVALAMSLGRRGVTA